MSTKSKPQAEATTPKRPTHNVFAVNEKGEDRKEWIEIGAAWAHADGQGFNILLKALPLPGAQIVMRTPREKSGEE